MFEVGQENCFLPMRNPDVMSNLDCKCCNKDFFVALCTHPYILHAPRVTPNLLEDMHHFYEIAHKSHNLHHFFDNLATFCASILLLAINASCVSKFRTPCFLKNTHILPLRAILVQGHVINEFLNFCCSFVLHGTSS